MSLRLAFITIALATTVVTVALLHNFGYVSFAERPGFTHVWGHVSYNGKPVPGCAIYFQPADPNSSHWGVGRLNDSGLYFITAYQLEYDSRARALHHLHSTSHTRPGRLECSPS